MIETNQTTDQSVESQPTPQNITTTMIIEDLENGIDRKGIQTKYSLETWEVAEMFKHPVLKGKKVKKKRKLSFNFIDDSSNITDPAQVTVQDVIDDVMGPDNNIAQDFHEQADLRTKDAIGDTDVYTDEQKEQMNGQAWEEEIQGRQQMDAQDQLNEFNNEEDEF
tara:strand:- start:67251 stop:67745 length:495 start_codon:yes stop_codon:yes gene_type:complete